MSAPPPSTPPASKSLSGRMAAFFSPGKKQPKEPRSPTNQTQAPPAEKHAEADAANGNCAASAPRSPGAASSSSSSSGSGFFSSLRARLGSSISKHRDEVAERTAFKHSALEKINSRMYTLNLPQEATKQLTALDSYLTTYHDGRYLLLDVGGVLSSHDCPDDLFRSARLSLEFGGGAGLGPIDGAARIAAAARRWWAAEDEAATTSTTEAMPPRTNIVVLAAEPLAIRQILCACILYEGMEFTEITQALHSVLLASENRLLASFHLRSLPASTKKFMSDFALVQRYDRDFKTPKVWLHDLRIHRLPQFEEEGTRLLIVIIANRSQFLYTSQAQGGGHLWIPTNQDDPLTAVVPLAVQFSGEASIKIWHMPEHSTVNNPRQLILETKVSSAVLCLPCWKMPELGQSDPPPVEPNADPAALPSSSAPSTYPLHRLFLRQNELELNSTDHVSHEDPLVASADVVYHKNFRMSITCTPMEEVHYRDQQTNGSCASAAASSSSSSAASSAAPAALLPIAEPVLEEALEELVITDALPAASSPSDVDLQQLAAAWGAPQAASESLDLLTAPSSPPQAFSLAGGASSPISSPLATRTPANSSADMNPPSSSFVTPARRKASSVSSPPSAAAAATASTFTPPVISVPPTARTTAGIRFFAEDKDGMERAETAAEYERRVGFAEERAHMDAMFGPGNWRKQGGILYTLSEQPQQQILQQMGHMHPLEMQARMQQMQQQQQQQQQHQHAQHYHHGHGHGHGDHAHMNHPHVTQGQAEAEAARQHQMQQDAAAQAQSIAQLEAAQTVMCDPNASIEQRDEAMAFMLAAQFAREDAEAAAQQQQQQNQQDAAQRSQRSSSHRSGGRSSRSSRSSRTPSSAVAAAAAAAAAPLQPSSVSIGADGSLVLAASAGASAAAADGSASAMPATDDESLARALQADFDREQAALAAHSVASLAAAQGRLDPDAMHYDQRLALEELMGPARPSVGRSRARIAAPATHDQIAQLPTFVFDGARQLADPTCSVCQETYVAGEILRRMQCMHVYHAECIDPWLQQQGSCAVCKVPIHRMH